ncbi:MAG: hypothetical protein J5995_06840 [Muribaculaceae bacterium]|nr:hypothetical protein [Muribaculaceae bacterium]
MRKLRDFAFACVLTLLAACGSSNDPLEEGNHRVSDEEYGKLYTYTFSFGGDRVDESDEPLTKAESSSSSYVGINVKRRAIDSSASSESEQYAHGVFLYTEGISITLVGGFLYSFEATILRDRDDVYRPNNNNYPAPFSKTTIGENNPVGYDSMDLNKFIYKIKVSDDSKTSDYWLCQLGSGTARVTSFSNTTTFDYPRVDRLYGVLSDFNPSADEPNITISMKYKSFGFRIECGSIPDDTYVTWKDVTKPDNDDNVTLKFPDNCQISPDSGPWEGVYSLNDLKSDEKQILLEFTWHKGAGETEKFTAQTTVQAKHKRVLKVSITGTPNTTKNGNIILESETSDLTVDTAEEISNKTGK